MIRRHLARKHSTNYKCAKEGCDKTFAKQYQVRESHFWHFWVILNKFQFDAHMKLHMHRSCHMCGKQFKRKQNADIHLMGVHGLTKDDLATLGRWLDQILGRRRMTTASGILLEQNCSNWKKYCMCVKTLWCLDKLLFLVMNRCQPNLGDLSNNI